MLNDPPTGYERATGVLEERRQCSDCKATFPATHERDVKCPKCGSENSKKMTPGSAFPRLAK